MLMVPYLPVIKGNAFALPGAQQFRIQTGKREKTPECSFGGPAGW
jgi:hypothetical protein